MTLLPHPSGIGEPCVTIRRWQLHATNGNATAAALLGVFEVYHASRLRAKSTQGTERDHIDLLQHHTTDQLVDRINRIATDKTVRNAVKLLAQKGFISVHSNPNQAKSWDKTKYYLFHPEIAISAIQGYQKNAETAAIKPPVNLPDHPVNLPDRSGKNDCIDPVKTTASSLYLREVFKEVLREEPEIFSEEISTPNLPPVDRPEPAPPIDRTADRNLTHSAPPLLPPRHDRPWKTGTGSNDWDEGFLAHILKYLQSLQGGQSKSRIDAMTWINNRAHPAAEAHGILRARWDEYKAEAAKPRPMTDEELAIYCAKETAKSNAEQKFIRAQRQSGISMGHAMDAWRDMPEAEKVALYRANYHPPVKRP